MCVFLLLGSAATLVYVKTKASFPAPTPSSSHPPFDLQANEAIQIFAHHVIYSHPTLQFLSCPTYGIEA